MSTRSTRCTLLWISRCSHLNSTKLMATMGPAHSLTTTPHHLKLTRPRRRHLWIRVPAIALVASSLKATTTNESYKPTLSTHLWQERTLE